MDVEYYKTIRYYIECVVASGNTTPEALTRLLGNCPKEFFEAYTSKKYNLTYSKNTLSFVAEPRSLSSVSLGVCYYLALSKWNNASNLIMPLISMLNYKMIPPVYNTIPIQITSLDRFVTERMIWSNFCIIPATLFSYAATLDSEDLNLEVIVKALNTYWLRFVKFLIKHFDFPSILPSKTSPTNLEDDKNQPPPNNILWYTMALSFASIGMYFALEPVDLARFIIEPEKFEKFRHKSILIKIEPSELVIKTISDLLNEHFLKLLNEKFIKCRVNFFSPAEKHSVFSIFISSISFLNCQIGKYTSSHTTIQKCKIKNTENIIEAIEKRVRETVLFQKNIKMKVLSDVVNFEQLHIDKEYKGYIECLIECNVLMVYLVDTSSVTNLMSSFLKKFKSNIEGDWPLNRAEILLKVSYLHGILHTIKLYYDNLNKLDVLNYLTNLIVSPPIFITKIAKKVYFDILNSCSNLLSAFADLYFKEDTLNYQLNFEDAFYFHYCQKYLNMLLLCLESLIDQFQEDKNEILSQTVSTLSYPLLEYVGNFKDHEKAKNSKYTTKAIIASQALSFLGSSFNSFHGIFEFTLSLLHQCFMHPVCIIDRYLVASMVQMMLSKQNSAVFITTIDSFRKLILSPPPYKKTDSILEDFYEYPCSGILNTFDVIASNLTDEKNQVIFMENLLEIFIHITFNFRRNSHILVNYLPTFIFQLIKSVSNITQRIGSIPYDSNKIQILFKNFWVSIVVIGSANLGAYSKEIIEACREISIHSPPLVAQNLRSELQYNIKSDEKTLDQADLEVTRSLLIDCLECKNQSDISNQIFRLPALHVIFLTAIFEQETLAIDKNTSRFPQIFYYLEEPAIEKDKTNIATLVDFICNKIFDKFVNALLLRKSGYDFDKDLANHITFLLVKFNSEIKRAQRAADRYISALMNRFPHMLWNAAVVRTMLDFIHVLKVQSNNIYKECVSVTVEVPHTSLTYVLPDTKQKRVEIISDFQSRCSTLINEAAKCAPDVIMTILLDYLMENRLTFKETNNHFGIELLMSSIVTIDKQGTPQIVIDEVLSSSVNLSSKKAETFKKKQAVASKQALKTQDTSKQGFLSTSGYIATSRSHYIGKIDGILTNQTFVINNGQKYYPEFEKFLISRFNDRDTMSQSELTDFVMLVTSYICFTKRFVRKIIFQLCNMCVQNFSVHYIKLAIESWQWIFISCKEYQDSLLSSICSAWESTIFKKIGFFDFSPTMKKSELDCDYVNVHDKWIQFLAEKYDLSKFHSPFQVKLITQTVFDSMRLVLKAEPSSEYIQINCVPFLRLITLGLKLLQNRFLSNTFRRIEMREKIFRMILLYFSFDFVWPHPSRTSICLDLLNSIVLLLSNDKKLEIQDNLDSNSMHLETQSFSSSIPTQEHTKSQDSKNLTASGALIFRRSKTNLKVDSSPVESLSAGNVGVVGSLSNFSDSKSCYLYFCFQFIGNEVVSILRGILLAFIYREIERLANWLDPTDKFDHVAKYTRNPKAVFYDKFYQQNLKILYKVAPKSALMLIRRFPDIFSIPKDISNLMQNNPWPLIGCKSASNVFWLQGNDCPSPSDPVKSLILLWARTDVANALEFLSPSLHTVNIYTTQYAVSCFKHSHIDMVLFYIPQLVQSLRHDTWSYITRYIEWISQKNNLISHQFIWNMQTSIYMDEDSLNMDPVLGQKLNVIIDIIRDSLSEAALRFYNKEFNFFNTVTQISGTIKPYDKSERRQVCQSELSKIVPEPGVYLPTNPDSLVLDIDYTSGIPMQSAAKAPFLARFRVLICDTETVETVNQADTVDMEKLKEMAEGVVMKAVIFKVGDDVRQDMLALQLISLFKHAFSLAGLSLYLYPYKVVATSPGCGVIECVSNAKSRDQLGKSTDATLDEYFAQKFGDESSLSYKNARKCFTNSFAAFCIVSYVLQVKDRHNGNIMINDDGCIIHIDFGFLFESSPGGNIGFEPDMKITTEMLNILGGSVESVYFKNFLKEAIKGYLAIRKHENEIINIVALMLESNLPCFRSETIRRLKYRLSSHLGDKDAAHFFDKVINSSLLNVRTVFYDYIQKAQNEIPC